MVDDEVRRNATELRGTAEKLKGLARLTRSIDARDGLLDLAVRFERMAQHIEGACPPKA
jgi:hypothetical protein